MEKKDLFSQHSEVYAAFRPTYPEDLYQFFLSFVREKKNVWDCATGNGQVAVRLAGSFESVEASDISEQQLALAPRIDNVTYSVQPAEATHFPDESFDLITIAQALHWFDPENFFKEVNRVIRPGGVVAAWGYAHLRINDDIDALVRNYYHNVVGPYWDPARKLVEDQYASVAFPFDLIETPGFSIRTGWSAKHLLGYLESWSATQTYMKERNHNPVHELAETIIKLWGNNATLPVVFPIFLKMGTM